MDDKNNYLNQLAEEMLANHGHKVQLQDLFNKVIKNNQLNNNGRKPWVEVSFFEICKELEALAIRSVNFDYQKKGKKPENEHQFKKAVEKEFVTYLKEMQKKSRNHYHNFFIESTRKLERITQRVLEKSGQEDHVFAKELVADHLKLEEIRLGNAILFLEKAAVGLEKLGKDQALKHHHVDEQMDDLENKRTETYFANKFSQEIDAQKSDFLETMSTPKSINRLSESINEISINGMEDEVAFELLMAGFNDYTEVDEDLAALQSQYTTFNFSMNPSQRTANDLLAQIPKTHHLAVDSMRIDYKRIALKICGLLEVLGVSNYAFVSSIQQKDFNPINYLDHLATHSPKNQLMDAFFKLYDIFKERLASELTQDQQDNRIMTDFNDTLVAFRKLLEASPKGRMLLLKCIDERTDNTIDALIAQALSHGMEAVSADNLPKTIETILAQDITLDGGVKDDCEVDKATLINFQAHIDFAAEITTSLSADESRRAKYRNFIKVYESFAQRHIYQLKLDELTTLIPQLNTTKAPSKLIQNISAQFKDITTYDQLLMFTSSSEMAAKIYLQFINSDKHQQFAMVHTLNILARLDDSLGAEDRFRDYFAHQLELRNINNMDDLLSAILVSDRFNNLENPEAVYKFIEKVGDVHAYLGGQKDKLKEKIALQFNHITVYQQLLRHTDNNSDQARTIISQLRQAGRFNQLALVHFLNILDQVNDVDQPINYVKHYIYQPSSTEDIAFDALCAKVLTHGSLKTPEGLQAMFKSIHQLAGKQTTFSQLEQQLKSALKGHNESIDSLFKGAHNTKKQAFLDQHLQHLGLSQNFYTIVAKAHESLKKYGINKMRISSLDDLMMWQYIGHHEHSQFQPMAIKELHASLQDTLTQLRAKSTTNKVAIEKVAEKSKKMQKMHYYLTIYNRTLPAEEQNPTVAVSLQEERHLLSIFEHVDLKDNNHNIAVLIKLLRQFERINTNQLPTQEDIQEYIDSIDKAQAQHLVKLLRGVKNADGFEFQTKTSPEQVKELYEYYFMLQSLSPVQLAEKVNVTSPAMLKDIQSKLTGNSIDTRSAVERYCAIDDSHKQLFIEKYMLTSSANELVQNTITSYQQNHLRSLNGIYQISPVLFKETLEAYCTDQRLLNELIYMYAPSLMRPEEQKVFSLEVLDLLLASFIDQFNGVRALSFRVDVNKVRELLMIAGMICLYIGLVNQIGLVLGCLLFIAAVSLDTKELVKTKGLSSAMHDSIGLDLMLDAKAENPYLKFMLFANLWMLTGSDEVQLFSNALRFPGVDPSSPNLAKLTFLAIDAHIPKFKKRMSSHLYDFYSYYNPAEVDFNEIIDVMHAQYPEVDRAFIEGYISNLYQRYQGESINAKLHTNWQPSHAHIQNCLEKTYLNMSPHCAADAINSLSNIEKIERRSGHRSNFSNLSIPAGLNLEGIYALSNFQSRQIEKVGDLIEIANAPNNSIIRDELYQMIDMIIDVYKSDTAKNPQTIGLSMISMFSESLVEQHAERNSSAPSLI